MDDVFIDIFSSFFPFDFFVSRMKKIEIDKSRPVRFEEFCADNCVPSKRYVRTTTILAVPCYNSKQQECKQSFFFKLYLVHVHRYQWGTEHPD